VPESIEEIPPLQRGSMVHDVQFALFGALRDEGLLPVTPERLEGARRLFGGLLLRSPAFGLLTGTLAGTVAFLLWVYTAVAIVLLGAEFAALVHRRLNEPPVA